VGLIAILIGAGLILLSALPPVIRDPRPKDTKTLGDLNAPISVEEYADFQCPFCGQLARGTLRQVEDQYVKNGTVRIVFHHYAVIGQESIQAAIAAECAGEQGRFWEYYDTLYANQAGENQGAFSDQNLSKFAQGLNLDIAAFNACLNGDRYREVVRADTVDGQRRGVEGVPTLFINGRKVVGAISMQQFESAIGPLLQK
jgi:protein-disulfide isomerase